LPHFAHLRLSEISVREVDVYKVGKAREHARLQAAREEARARGEHRLGDRGLGNNAINMRPSVK
jgi:hypothetical protein